MPHRIQLRGPWNYQPLSAIDSQTELPPAGTAKMPVTWQEMLGPFRGSVRFTRVFHRPTNLEPEERVYLVFEGVGGSGNIAVNGTQLGTLQETISPQLFEVTALLRGDELLQLDLEFVEIGEPSKPGGLYGPVSIEIDDVLRT